MRPCASSCENASRTTFRLTPRLSASSSSTILWPGTYSPAKMASRIACTALLASGSFSNFSTLATESSGSKIIHDGPNSIFLQKVVGPLRVPRHVRRSHHIRHHKQRVTGVERLNMEDIERGSGDRAVCQCLQKSGFIHNLTPCH